MLDIADRVVLLEEGRRSSSPAEAIAVAFGREFSPRREATPL